MRGPVHLVLHHPKEAQRNLRLGIVINARSVNIQHLAPKDLLRRPDIPNPSQQLIKVIPTASAFKTLIIQGKALDQVLTQALGRPDAKLCAPEGVDPVANRDDGI